MFRKGNAVNSPESPLRTERSQTIPAPSISHTTVEQNIAPTAKSFAAQGTAKSTQAPSIAKPLADPTGYTTLALDPQLAIALAPVFQRPDSSALLESTDRIIYRRPHVMKSSHIPLAVNTSGSGKQETLAASNLHPVHTNRDTIFARPQPLPTDRTMPQLRAMHDAHNPAFVPINYGPTGQLPQPYPSPSNMNFRSPPMMGSTPSLPHFGFSFTPHSSQSSGIRSDSVTSFVSKTPHTDPQLASQAPSHHMTDTSILDQMNASSALPVFGAETYHHDYAMPDAFMGWLFSDEQNFLQSPPRYQPTSTHTDPIFQLPHLDERLSETATNPESIFSTAGISKTVVDSHQPESALSESRRQHLLQLIMGKFKDERHTHVTQHRAKILQGDLNSKTHGLGLCMMQMYIRSFWSHIHRQLPIMHRPTFCVETCPDLLLIAIMALGASCLEASHGLEVTKACADVAYFLAWHTRYLIFEDPDFLPPAKLWVFQALLLLEVFEKMYSTRSLHERAHVHHSTTLTLMRRGSSLIGRSAVDFPPYDNDPTRTPPGPNGSINTSGRNTCDEWWNYWISNEATRRTAFAAFIIDITHATMFGHSAVMVAHEMRLVLPCDEALWSATSGGEIKRLEQSLDANGVKPISFLEGLKQTLSSQPVRTNTFGRVIVMAGLLSVSWHARMQDVRAHSVGVGKQGSWGKQLLHAFDHWRGDFDASLQTDGTDKDNVFESRTVLHHLAHMAMHVDIIDCQIYAGAKRLLGRAITTQDHAAAQKRMQETWAPSARARDAAFYSVRFLWEVLMHEDHRSGHAHHYTSFNFCYSAREDNLLNRPWVLYFATLVIWAYGYALDGPTTSSHYPLTSRENQIYDMQVFLHRLGAVKSPDDLQHVPNRNNCLGLLMVLKEMFQQTRWELLHEASAVLGSCIDLSMARRSPS